MDQASPLTLQRVTLLHSEDVVAQRVTDMNAFALAVKAASDAVVAFDEASKRDSLPPEIDLLVVVRPGAVRCWMVSEGGDVAISQDLERAFAKLPIVPVREGSVAAVQTLARAPLPPADRNPFFPAEWRAAADPQRGSSIDDVIHATWPPPVLT